MALNGIKETKEFLEARLGGFKADLALIIGSGLGGLTDGLAKPIKVPYAEIPHFPKATVSGHAGELVAGELAGKRVLAMSGRFHLYAGLSPVEVVYPILAINALGVKLLIVTNTAGGIDPRFKPGDLMLIEDHINFMGINPLVGNGGNDSGVKFLDMTQAWSTRLREKLDAAAERAEVPLWRGIYLATTGPVYETPAEVKAFAWLGADAVGMSTVPEVIQARACNIEVVGISCITNLAAGITGKKLSHEEVLNIGAATQKKLGKLLAEFIGGL
jgi:purine-nucleoside phosphorylase